MSEHAPIETNSTDDDASTRLFRHARQEALITLFVWVLALIWTVGYCYLHGYQHTEDSWVVQKGWAVVHDPAQLEMTFGIPNWAFYGFVLPWLACTLFTMIYCGWFMHDDDLGAEQEDSHEV